LASAEAFSTAASAPEMTVWPGELRLAAETARPVGGQRKDGSHAALADGNGELHGAPASLDGAHGVGKGDRAGGHMGRPLAQRVTRSHLWPDSVQGQHARDGSAHRENCRLGVLRQLEIFRGAFGDQLCERETGGLIGLGEGVAGDGITLGKFVAHANSLRTLPRK
jgi:hypothetical protein